LTHIHEQWLEYHIFGGVEHFFWYDCAEVKEEFQENALQPFIQAGLMTYTKLIDFLPNMTKNFDFSKGYTAPVLHFMAVGYCPFVVYSIFLEALFIWNLSSSFSSGL
jgi:hypothetical protein